MFRTRVIPCLLLRNSALVKTVRFRDAQYVGDPVNTVRIFNEMEVDELIFLDITATPQQKPPPFELLRNIASECFMPFAYGGGVRSVEDMTRLFALGCEKVALNTAAVENARLVREAADRFGSQSVIASIDVKKKLFGGYEVCTCGGRKRTGLDPVRHAESIVAAGAGELLLTSIDRDGTMQGYDTDLVRRVAAAVEVPVIACGGAGQLEHFRRAVDAGASAVAAGSMVVYQGPHRAVLINFPSPAQLETAFAKQAA
jgi:imidazole glycerol-phosphate synthase subunit HisF